MVKVLRGYSFITFGYYPVSLPMCKGFLIRPPANQGIIKVSNHSYPALNGYLRSYGSMRLHNLKLCFSKNTGFKEYAVRYPHLSNIMHRTCKFYCFNKISRHIQCLGQLAGIQSYPFYMRACISVPEFRNHSQAVHNLIECAC